MAVAQLNKDWPDVGTRRSTLEAGYDSGRGRNGGVVISLFTNESVGATQLTQLST